MHREKENYTPNPNYTACPLFHNGFCMYLLFHFFYCELLATEGTKCQKLQKHRSPKSRLLRRPEIDLRPEA